MMALLITILTHSFKRIVGIYAPLDMFRFDTYM